MRRNGKWKTENQKGAKIVIKADFSHISKALIWNSIPLFFHTPSQLRAALIPFPSVARKIFDK